MSLPHETRPVLVWVDADIGVADMVEYLNTIPGVRTQASCQGTIGEGGPNPYRAQVMCTWTPEALVRLKAEFDVEPEGNGSWGYVHPKEQRMSAPHRPDVDEFVKACKQADWQQVVLNGGPPCFHLENGKLCLRAERWHDHPDIFHPYITLAKAVQAHIAQLERVREAAEQVFTSDVWHKNWLDLSEALKACGERPQSPEVTPEKV